jgi:inosose dehydratase
VAIEIGNGPVTWGVWSTEGTPATPWPRFLDEVAEAGFAAIELGPLGYLPTDLPTLEAALEARNLTVAGGTLAARMDLGEALHALGPLLKGVSARYLCLIPERQHDGDWQARVDAMHRTAEVALTRYGLATVVHAELHSEIFAEPGIEAFIAASDPSLVNYCLDVGLHACGGGDPVAFMRTHHARIPYLHLTNIDGAVAARVRTEHVPFDAAVEMGLFRGPSDGAVDYPALRTVLADVGYAGWAISEHPSKLAEPLPQAKRARDYLRHIGIG